LFFRHFCGRQQAPANARKLPPPETLLHGIIAAAVGMQNEAELAKLRELGFDGATGPGVKG
jgi:hypothetical protein